MRTISILFCGLCSVTLALLASQGVLAEEKPAATLDGKPVDEIFEALVGHDPQGRRGARHALLEAGDEAVPHLRRALMSERRVLREAALGLLPEFGEVAAPVLEDVSELLADAQPETRVHAMRALGSIARRLRTLGKPVGSKETPAVLRERLVQSLAQMADIPHIQVEGLVAAVRLGPAARELQRTLVLDRSVRTESVVRMWRTTPDALDVVRDLLAHPSWMVRRQTLATLGVLPRDAPPFAASLVPLLDDESSAVALAALEALGRAARYDRSARELTLQGFESQHRIVRDHTPRAAGHIVAWTPKRIEQVLATLQEPLEIRRRPTAAQESQAQARAAAAWCLGSATIERERVVAALYQALDDDDATLRMAAARSLAIHDETPEEALDALAHAVVLEPVTAPYRLVHRSETTQARTPVTAQDLLALEAASVRPLLRKFGLDATEYLATRVAEGRYDANRWSYLHALGELGPAGLSALRAFLADPDRDLRRRAALTLLARDPQSFDALMVLVMALENRPMWDVEEGTRPAAAAQPSEIDWHMTAVHAIRPLGRELAPRVHETVSEMPRAHRNRLRRVLDRWLGARGEPDLPE